MVCEVSRVSPDGREVDLHVPGMNLQRFRVRTDTLSFVERKPAARTSNPFTNPEPTLDSAEILKRIATVREENLKRLDDDIDVLKTYLKTQRAPKAAIEALEGPDHRTAQKLEKGGRTDNKVAGQVNFGTPSGCRYV